MPYITIEEGDMFGILDLVPETKETIIDKEIQRQFTVMAMDYSDILCLSLEVFTLLLTYCRTFRASTNTILQLLRKYLSKLVSALAELSAYERKPLNSTSIKITTASTLRVTNSL